MPEERGALAGIFDGWGAYQEKLAKAVAPLTAEQLTLRVAPNLRSIGEIALHIVGCRVYWFTEFLGEDGGEELEGYARWNRVALGAPYASWDELSQALGAPVPTAAALAQGLGRTWHFTADCLARWSPADLSQTFPDDEDGTPVEVSRAWVVWYVLQHDLHHGGELSLTLGAHGLQAPDI
jgi:uncharacterized damage-inducible protein DinB